MTVESTKRVRSDIVTDVERPWMVAIQELGPGAVWKELVGQGVSPAVAGNIVDWLEAHAKGERRRSPDSRTRYRKVLAGLTPIMFEQATIGAAA
jgi:hypothetical protein